MGLLDAQRRRRENGKALSLESPSPASALPGGVAVAHQPLTLIALVRTQAG